MAHYIIIGLVTLAIIAGGLLFIGRSGKTRQPVATPQGNSIRYVALGDSYTIGEGETQESRWPNQLVSQLKSDGIELDLVANPSRTGYTTQDLLDREINVLKDNNPAFVTLLIGVNDYFQGVSANEFKQRFSQMLDTIQKTSPNAKLLIVTIPDYGKTPTGARSGNPASIEAGIREYNQIISDEAVQRMLPVADIFAISQQSSQAGELINDGLHPSGDQYNKWLQVVKPEAIKLLR